MSQLSGINIFEDKANLAPLLQPFQEIDNFPLSSVSDTNTEPSSSVKTLATHMVNNQKEFSAWCTVRFSNGNASKGGVWIAKDTNANEHKAFIRSAATTGEML